MSCSPRSLLILVLCITGLLLLTDPALGAVGRWTPFGPPTGEIQEMLADPTVPRLLYALTESGVYRSGDGGDTWGWSGAGLPRGVTALALDAQRPGTLWAADSFSVFRSRDRGAHWRRVSGDDFQPFPPPPGSIAGRVLLAALPGDPAVLFYAGHGYLGLWRSADGGRTWSAVPEVHDILLLKTDRAGRVYAAQMGGILWRSDDAGLRWRRLAAIPGDFFDLAVSPGRRPLLYATNGISVYRSRNQGASWQPVLPAPEGGLMGALAVDPQHPQTVYVAANQFRAPSVLVSDDAGASWKETAGLATGGVILSLLVEPARRTLHAISHWDVASSQNQGRTWMHRVLAARVPAFNSHLRFDPADPSRLFAVTGGRLFFSSDHGRTWMHLPVRHRDNLAEVTDLAFDPVRPRFLYVAATGIVLLSRDRGLTWTPRATEPISGIERIAFPGRSHLLAAGWGLFRSADRGQTWTETLSGQLSETLFRTCDRLDADPAEPRRFFARCSLLDFSGPGEPREHGTALWRSQDGGWSWTELPGLGGVTFDPTNPGTVYGWTWNPSPIFRSQDGGATWEPAGEARDHGWTALLVDPRSPEILYGATNGYPMEMERSRDGGLTWEPAQDGFAGVTTWADGLWAHPSIPHQIYLVVDGGAFYEARFPEE